MAPICIEHSIEMGSNTNILDIEFQEQDRSASHCLAKNLMARIFSSALTFTMKSS